MNDQKPKTHYELNRVIKPGQTITLKSGDIIRNDGRHNARLTVMKPIEMEKKPNESESK